MQPTTSALANFLEGLSATLKEAAEAARKLHDGEADLPPVLHTRHIAVHQDISPTTAWRRARLGSMAPCFPTRASRSGWRARPTCEV